MNYTNPISPLRACRDYSERLAAMSEAAIRSVLVELGSAVASMRRTAGLAKEYEARFDLTEVPDAVKDSASSVIDIRQGTVASSEDRTVMVRVRSSSERGKGTEYTMTAKCYPTSDEAETEISKDIFDGLYPSLSRKEVKTRYVWNGWDIDDISEGDRAGKVVAEFEHDGSSEVEVPAELRVVLKRAGGDDA